MLFSAKGLKALHGSKLFLALVLLTRLAFLMPVAEVRVA